MWRAALKSLLARKLRLLLTAFAVVLGELGYTPAEIARLRVDGMI